MFRKNLRLTLYAVLALPFLAGSAFAGPLANQPPAHAQTPAVADVRVLDTHDYVQTELDWRSYYLNRQPGRIGLPSPDGDGQAESGWLWQPAADGS